jgi:hypothetical protein
MSRFQFAGLDFIYVAPGPGFPGLNGADQRVLATVKMFGGVFVFRGITAAHMSAFEAQAQVKPGISSFYAVFANVLVRLGKFDLIQMSAFLCHRFLRLWNYPDRFGVFFSWEIHPGGSLAGNDSSDASSTSSNSGFFRCGWFSSDSTFLRCGLFIFQLLRIPT